MNVFIKIGLIFAVSTVTQTYAATFSQPAKIPYFTVDNSSASTSTVDLGKHLVIISSDAKDALLGRRSELALTFSLPEGIRFEAEPIIEPGSSLSGWSVVNEGGASGNGILVIRISPSSGNAISAGPMLIIKNIKLLNAVELGSEGGSVHLTAEAVDINAQESLAKFEGTLVEAVDALQVSYDPNDVYYPDKKIDIGTGRTTFAFDGRISSDNRGIVTVFDAGSIHIGSTSDLIDARNGEAFVFDPSTYKFSTTIKTASQKLFIHLESGHCEDPNRSVVGGNLTDPSTFNTIEYSTRDLGSDHLPLTAHVCMYADGSPIKATTVHASTSVSFGSLNTKKQYAGGLRPMNYNGSFASVTTFNPGGNTIQQSFLRVINLSDQAGKVTIEGTSDGGVESGKVSFVLDAGGSRQLNSDMLENGATDLTGSLGFGSGKWRLEVFGEFERMRVQSLVRNNNTGTVTNLSSDVVSSSSN